MITLDEYAFFINTIKRLFNPNAHTAFNITKKLILRMELHKYIPQESLKFILYSHTYICHNN